METWRPIKDFPGYSISDLARVRNDNTGVMLTINQNNFGIHQVSLYRRRERYNRSLTVLVAKTFLDPHPLETFDTPIQLNGDRGDNSIENLMWRPRWFAVDYHRQFHRPHSSIIDPVIDLDTREQFPSSWIAATTFGLIDRELVKSILNHNWVWPTYQYFRIVHSHIN